LRAAKDRIGWVEGPAAEDDERFSDGDRCAGRESKPGRLGRAAGRASLDGPAADANRVAGTSIYQLDELILSAVSYGIVIGVTRVAGRWIGEYFIDENRATRIAGEINSDRIAFTSILND